MGGFDIVDRASRASAATVDLARASFASSRGSSSSSETKERANDVDARVLPGDCGVEAAASPRELVERARLAFGPHIPVTRARTLAVDVESPWYGPSVDDEADGISDDAIDGADGGS